MGIDLCLPTVVEGEVEVVVELGSVVDAILSLCYGRGVGAREVEERNPEEQRRRAAKRGRGGRRVVKAVKQL